MQQKIYFDTNGRIVESYVGRPKPLRKPNKVPMGDSWRIFKSTNTKYLSTYPKSANTDKSKFDYLKNLLAMKSIDTKVFVELALVLPTISKKAIKTAVLEAMLK